MYQAYQSIYSAKVSAEVQRMWKRKWDDYRQDDGSGEDRDPPPIPINFRNQVARDLLNEETDEVKAEVDRFRKDHTNAEEGDADSSATITEQHARAKAYQR